MGAVLALDPGTRYVGVAVSNPERTLALPVSVLDATPKQALVAAIAALVKDRDVDQLVVGRPLALRGTPIPMTAVAETFADDLRVALKLPIELVDERLSTKSAHPAGSQGGRVDASAAALFLQTYLDRTSREGERA